MCCIQTIMMIQCACHIQCAPNFPPRANERKFLRMSGHCLKLIIIVLIFLGSELAWSGVYIDVHEWLYAYISLLHNSKGAWYFSSLLSNWACDLWVNRHKLWESVSGTVVPKYYVVLHAGPVNLVAFLSHPVPYTPSNFCYIYRWFVLCRDVDC